MTEVLLAVLWVLVIVLAVIVLALARQVGILHERVAPAGALTPVDGPKIGEVTEPMELQTLSGEDLVIGGVEAAGLLTLVMFVSPTCPICKSLVPVAKSLQRREKGRMRLVFASDGDKLERHRAYARDLDLADYPYVLSQPLGIRYAVSKLPFAVLIGSDGTLHGKGLVNTREHLESLIEAMDTGVANLQEYVSALSPANENSVAEASYETR